MNQALTYQAEMQFVVVAKNCGVAYMLLGKPEMYLPMIERATTMLNFMSYASSFQVLITLQDWPKATLDFVHIHKLFA